MPFEKESRGQVKARQRARRVVAFEQAGRTLFEVALHALPPLPGSRVAVPAKRRGNLGGTAVLCAHRPSQVCFHQAPGAACFLLP